jgi:hypothetical protein
MAPEVCNGDIDAGTVPATRASDVYMLGGLLYELLTGGLEPFHWLSRNPMVVWDRRRSEDPIPLGGCMLAGLRGKSVLEAAAIDGEAIPWRVRVEGSPGSAARLEELKGVLASLLTADPKARPTLRAVEGHVVRLLREEERGAIAAATATAAAARGPVPGLQLPLAVPGSTPGLTGTPSLSVPMTPGQVQRLPSGLIFDML